MSMIRPHVVPRAPVTAAKYTKRGIHLDCTEIMMRYYSHAIAINTPANTISQLVATVLGSNN